MRKIISLVIAALVIWLAVGTIGVRASGFTVDSIGNVNTGGANISQWWYTSTNVTFKGTALPGATVNTSIDGITSSVTADSSGSWSYTPGNLSEGDKSVSFDSNGSTIKFTLTLGANNVDWEKAGSGGSPTLLTTGTREITFMLILGGLVMAAVGGKMVFSANKS